MGESSSIRSDLVSGQAADSALQENQISTSAATAAERHLNSRSRGKGKGSAVAVRELHGSSSTSIIDNLLGEGRSSALPRNIVEVPVKALRCNPRNARRHSTKQIECLTASIRRFGFKGVIVIAPSGQILAGHARFQAAKLLELERMPCLVVTDLDDPAMRAFSLADNRLAEQSEWDEEVLKLELAALESLDLDFGLELTGFGTIDIDRILGPEPDPTSARLDKEGYSGDPDDQLPEPIVDGSPVSRLNDLWELGGHLLYNGDATEPRSYQVLLANEKVRQIVTDPPYNVPISRHVSSARGFREFQQAAGEMTQQGFTRFLARSLELAAATALDGAILEVFMDWRHLPELLTASQTVGLTYKNLCVWVKSSAGMGSFYRSQHELIAVLKTGTAPHINNFGLGQHGRNRSNVWTYPAVRGLRRGVNNPRGGHPTVKPVSMIIDAIKDCSNRGDVVLDPFGGSGTTLIAAERTRRRARLIELDSHYCDLTIRRFELLTGQVARLAGDGRSFAEIATARGSPACSPNRGSEGDINVQE